jgi:hypothetical protein
MSTSTPPPCPVCPRCQATIFPGWAVCPSCNRAVGGDHNGHGLPIFVGLIAVAILWTAIQVRAGGPHLRGESNRATVAVAADKESVAADIEAYDVIFHKADLVIEQCISQSMHACAVRKAQDEVVRMNLDIGLAWSHRWTDTAERDRLLSYLRQKRDYYAMIVHKLG